MILPQNKDPLCKIEEGKIPLWKHFVMLNTAQSSADNLCLENHDVSQLESQEPPTF